MEKSNVIIQNLLDVPIYAKEVALCQWKEWGVGKQDTIDGVLYRVLHSMKEDDIPQTLVATIDNQLVGTVSIWRNDLCARQDLYPWLSCLYVKEEFRHSKIGTMLQNKAMDVAKHLGYSKIYLITDHDYLYEKNSWKFIEMAPLGDGRMTKLYEHLL